MTRRGPIFWLLFVFSVLGLCACSSDASEDDGEESSADALALNKIGEARSAMKDAVTDRQDVQARVAGELGRVGAALDPDQLGRFVAAIDQTPASQKTIKTYQTAADGLADEIAKVLADRGKLDAIMKSDFCTDIDPRHGFCTGHYAMAELFGDLKLLASAATPKASAVALEAALRAASTDPTGDPMQLLGARYKGEVKSAILDPALASTTILALVAAHGDTPSALTAIAANIARTVGVPIAWKAAFNRLPSTLDQIRAGKYAPADGVAVPTVPRWSPFDIYRRVAALVSLYEVGKDMVDGHKKYSLTDIGNILPGSVFSLVDTVNYGYDALRQLGGAGPSPWLADVARISTRVCSGMSLIMGINGAIDNLTHWQRSDADKVYFVANLLGVASSAMYLEGSLLIVAPYVGLIAGTVAFAGYLLAKYEKSKAEAADMAAGLGAAGVSPVLRARLPKTKPGAIASLARDHGLTPSQIREIVEWSPRSVSSDFVGLRHLETSFGLSPADTAHVLHDLAGKDSVDSLIWFTDEHPDTWQPADWLAELKKGAVWYGKESPPMVSGLNRVQAYLETRH